MANRKNLLELCCIGARKMSRSTRRLVAVDSGQSTFSSTMNIPNRCKHKDGFYKLNFNARDLGSSSSSSSSELSHERYIAASPRHELRAMKKCTFQAFFLDR